MAQKRQVGRVYKPRGAGNSDYPQWTIAFPREVIEALGSDRQYRIELTEEGVLYRLVDESITQPEIPAWMKGGGSE